MTLKNCLGLCLGWHCSMNTSMPCPWACNCTCVYEGHNPWHTVYDFKSITSLLQNRNLVIEINIWLHFYFINWNFLWKVLIKKHIDLSLCLYKQNKFLNIISKLVPCTKCITKKKLSIIKYSQTWINDHLWIRTICLQQPLFWGPNINYHNVKLPLNKDHMSTTATNFGFQGWFLYTCLTVFAAYNDHFGSRIFYHIKRMVTMIRS